MAVGSYRFLFEVVRWRYDVAFHVHRSRNGFRAPGFDLRVPIRRTKRFADVGRIWFDTRVALGRGAGRSSRRGLVFEWRMDAYRRQLAICCFLVCAVVVVFIRAEEVERNVRLCGIARC